ncbi:MAG: efflux RND transporter permease subunit, partial [Chlamydiota bacterium]|nr:efflux RND transporter permease subunit [Chlamydiota bacterium]
MFLSDLSIRRPVLATVMSLILIILGWISYTLLPVRELPDVDFPVVTVNTTLQGASPEIVEEEVTDVMESEINTIEGIKHITSQSSEGSSNITIEFELERNIDVAAQDVRDKISRIRRLLPDDIDEPSISKLDLDAQAIMWIAVRGESWSQADITYYADKVLKEQLQKVNGVGSIIVGGAKRFAVRIWLDIDKLTARKLTVNDVIEALRDKNVELPSGRIEGLQREFTVKTEGELYSIEAFNQLIIRFDKGTPIRLSDIGNAAEGVENDRTLARFNGESAVGLGILKQTEANTIDVADGVKAKLEKLKKDVPEGIELWIAFDSSTFIKDSIQEVKETLFIAGGLVILVIFLFLRNLRATIMPAVAMPISIISTFAVMHFMGFTLNNFTLLALVLSVGIVVDDAIIMLENIYRHIEEGYAPMEAAKIGSSEIAFAVIATTLTLSTVFLPVAFMEGQIGRFFYEFGISVSIAVIVSAFIALTLTPMLCSRVLSKKTKHNIIYRLIESIYTFFENMYKHLIRWTLYIRLLIVAAGFATLIFSAYFFQHLGKEFVPTEDRGSFMILLEAPEGSTLEYTNRYLKQIEDLLATKKEIRSYFAALALGMAGNSNVNKGLLFVRMIDANQRPHQDVILKKLRSELFRITGINAFAITFNPLVRGSSKSFEYLIQHPDFEKLKEYSQKFTEQLKETPGFIEVDTDLELNKPEVRVYIDRNRCADLGVSIREIATTLNTLLGGNNFTKYKYKGERYDVILQLKEQDRQIPDVINSIYVRGNHGNLVRLNNIVRIEEGVGPSVINRFDRMRAVKIEANLEDITLGDALNQAERIATDILPSDFITSVTGQAEEMGRSFQSLILTFVLAIILVYLILSAQFESFLYPISIMGALPLSLIGALGSLYYFGMSINIYSIIGMIMLIGLVTKNSILLVDYTNTLRSRGMERKEAVQEAGRVRLRPILMTAISTIFGIIPIALGLGAGAESRQPMGMAIVGGMFSATLLTLFVVPA